MIEPLNYFLPYQIAWLNEAAPLAIGEKSRRIGFTHVHAYKTVEGRVKGRTNYWHSSADMSAAVEFIDDCKLWCEVFNIGAKVIDAEEVIEDEKITTRQLIFANGNKIVGGSSNPKFFRSKGGDVGLDEFAFHAQGRELLKAAQATAIFWGHQMSVWSTHNGEGSYFNGLVNKAKSGELKAALHTVTVMDAVEQGLVEKILKLKAQDDKARQEWLDNLRATCADQDTWNEEYMCLPSSEQSSLLSYPLIQGCETPNLQLMHPLQLPTTGTLYAGFDVARKKDLSVLWVIERVGDVFWTRCIHTMQDVTFTAQEDLLRKMLQNPAVKRLCIDSTGMGMMLAERLGEEFSKYRAEGVSFTAPVKSELAMPLQRLFQDKLIRVPADATVREDLHKIRKVVTAANNIRLDADRDEAGHADRFWALALAYHGADALRMPLPPSRAFKPAGW
jgi:phage FluMu gp28-like protein